MLKINRPPKSSSSFCWFFADFTPKYAGGWGNLSTFLQNINLSTQPKSFSGYYNNVK